jgi:hypothetical protein
LQTAVSLAGIVSVTMKTVADANEDTRSRKKTNGTVGWIPVKTAVSERYLVSARGGEAMKPTARARWGLVD